MSAAASLHKIESPDTQEDFESDGDLSEHEKSALETLATISTPDAHGLVIAVDLDDVLSQTNHSVARWHNDTYGSQMSLDSFYYYYYWKNPFWGNPRQTFDKVKKFYETELIYQAAPVPGAREGVETLRRMGFRLIIVTAREADTRERSWNWVNQHFPDVFHSVVCTGQFRDADKQGRLHEVVTKLSKAQVCADLGAKLLVDDSAENAISCATASTPTQVLLFGEYQWNQRLSGPGDARDEMAFDQRLKREGDGFWKKDTMRIPKGAPLWRVKDWSDVIRWIIRAQTDGTL